MLRVAWEVSLKITDGTIVNFDSGRISGTSNNEFDQGLGVDIIIPPGASDFQISMQGIDFGQMIFMHPSHDLRIKLVTQGYDLSQAIPMTLLAKKPSLLAVKDVIGIYVSNTGTVPAMLNLELAGTDAPATP